MADKNLTGKYAEYKEIAYMPGEASMRMLCRAEMNDHGIATAFNETHLTMMPTDLAVELLNSVKGAIDLAVKKLEAAPVSREEAMRRLEQWKATGIHDGEPGDKREFVEQHRRAQQVNVAPEDLGLPKCRFCKRAEMRHPVSYIDSDKQGRWCKTFVPENEVPNGDLN